MLRFEARPDELAFAVPQPIDELGPAAGRHLLREDRAHRRPHRFDRERVGAVVDKDQPAGADGVAGPQDRPDIAGIAQRLSDNPQRRLEAVDVGEGGIGLPVRAEQHLRIVLAAHLREDIGRGFDRVAVGRFGPRDDLGRERVLCALRRESDDLGQPSAVAGLGEDPQPFREKQSFRLARLLVAQGAQQLDRGVGESGDLARHGLVFAEPFFDKLHEFRQRLVGRFSLDMDDDRIAHGGAEHHQTHDRRAADAVAVLLDLDLGVDLAGDIDELGACPGVEAALVVDPDLAADGGQAAASPRISDATEIYLRPASRAAATAAWTPITLRAPSSRISIGRFTPAMTSTFSLFIRLIARLDGVPPNRSVRMITPWPRSTLAIAAAMSLRRPSMSSSGPMQIASTASCGPTTCSNAVTNSAASRPWVTSTNPIIRSTRLPQASRRVSASIVSLGGEARSRWRTFGSKPDLRNRSAISAAAATDRWRPPVQPNATVT